MNVGLFKLNVRVKKQKKKIEIIFFAYLIVSSDIWHDRLGQLNYDTLLRLIKMNHVLTFQIDLKIKCEICIKLSY